MGESLMRLSVVLLCWFALLPFLSNLHFAAASDWSRFRGPNGIGVSADAAPVPVEWSESKNLKWKLSLPGPGLSSPIVVGNRVFVTCWSGYGVDAEKLGV